MDRVSFNLALMRFVRYKKLLWAKLRKWAVASRKNGLSFKVGCDYFCPSFLFHGCCMPFLETLLSPLFSLPSFDRSLCTHLLRTRHRHPLGEKRGTTFLPLWLKPTEGWQVVLQLFSPPGCWNGNGQDDVRLHLPSLLVALHWAGALSHRALSLCPND